MIELSSSNTLTEFQICSDLISKYSRSLNETEVKHTQVFKLKSCPSLTSSQSVRQANQNISYVYFTNAIINNDVTRSVKVLRKSRAMNKTFTCVSKRSQSERWCVYYLYIIYIIWRYFIFIFIIFATHWIFAYLSMCFPCVFSSLSATEVTTTATTKTTERREY